MRCSLKARWILAILLVTGEILLSLWAFTVYAGTLFVIYAIFFALLGYNGRTSWIQNDITASFLAVLFGFFVASITTGTCVLGFDSLLEHENAEQFTGLVPTIKAVKALFALPILWLIDPLLKLAALISEQRNRY